jgi:septum site-determining protein MinC
VISKPDILTIKGSRQGLLVTLREGNWEDLLAELAQRLADQPAFFKGGRVSLNVGELALTEDDIRRVRDLLIRHDVTLHGVIGRDAQTEAAAQALGLVIDLGLERRPPPAFPSSSTGDSDGGEAMVVQRTLRSGQSIRHAGHVVVIGDVNPGAEIVAGGHVVVWGALRGIVHAGAPDWGGDETALICALDMSPTQLRIAGHITRAPDERRRKTMPEVAAVRDGQIVAMPWR